MNENIIENPSDISFNSELSTSELEISQDEICEESIINKDKQVSLVINSISSTLEKLINNEKQKKDTDLKELIKPFNSKTISEISINDYLKRIIKYTNCEINSLIYSIILLDRICLKNINLSSYNIHKFLFATILLAIKINEDNIYSNTYYSQIAGVSLKELNLMEYNFFILLDYKFYVNEDIYEEYKKGLNLEYM
jgi:hypothetical protein